MATIEQRLEGIKAEITALCEEAGRSADDLVLVAVSKNHPADSILTAYQAGHRDFGESRFQELRDKAAILPDDIRWHFIGRLQSNKAKAVAEICHTVHTLENPRQISEIAKSKANIEGFVQVNIARESQKSGIYPQNLDSMVSYVLKCPQVRFRGLMTIGPLVTDPEESRIIFRQLAELNRKVGGTQLSMGMSNDYRIALQEGATHIRIGTAIFGDR